MEIVCLATSQSDIKRATAGASEGSRRRKRSRSVSRNGKAWGVIESHPPAAHLLALALALSGIVSSIVGCRFQRKEHAPPVAVNAELHAVPDPAPPPGNDRTLVWRCSAEGLDSELLEVLRRVAAKCHQQTGETIVINSGRRTLRHQARLMAEMTRDQLEGMYCRRGYPSYIRDIVLARERDGDISADETYGILCSRTEGFISSHLSGAAIDISPRGIDVALLKSLLAEHGFSVLDERSLGVECIHATFLAAPKHIVRE